MSDTTAKKAPPRDLASEVRRKELGYFSHFLDAVWDNLGKSTVLAVGVAAVSGYMNGGFSPYLVPTALLASFLPAAGLGVMRVIEANERARLHDSPKVQRFIKDIEAKAEGVVASQRGSVWLVREPGVAGVHVMNDREYDRFKRNAGASGMAIDEVVFRKGEATVTRTSGGRLDPAGRDLPAVMRMDAGTGRATWMSWMLGGRAADREQVAQAAGKVAYRATSFLSGGTGNARDVDRKPMQRPAYSASRFLSGGSGHEDADMPSAPAFGR